MVGGGLIFHKPANAHCVRVCWQLAEAIPVAGSGLKLPLDLHTIGSRCSNAYFAPRRFAAVQLAFDSPRCRVLIFHTGRLVGTGRALLLRLNLVLVFFSPKSLPHRLRGPDGRPTLHHAGRTTAGRRGQRPHPRPKFSSDQPSVSMQFEHAHVRQQSRATLALRWVLRASTLAWIATPLLRRTRRRATMIVPVLSGSRGDRPRSRFAAVSLPSSSLAPIVAFKPSID